MPIELTVLSILTLASANYWLWVFSKKEFTIVTNVETPAPTIVHQGNVEMLELSTKDGGVRKTARKEIVPLPDPAALMKNAPTVSFGSRAKSGE